MVPFDFLPLLPKVSPELGCPVRLGWAPPAVALDLAWAEAQWAVIPAETGELRGVVDRVAAA